MAIDDQSLLKRLLATFKLEAAERLASMSSLVLQLEQLGSTAPPTEIVETIFREAHSLKGAARSVSQHDIERLCAALETLFQALKQGEISPSPALITRLYQSLDGLGVMVGQTVAPEGKPSEVPLAELIAALELLSHGAEPAAQVAVPASATAPDERAIVLPAANVSTATVRIATEKLNTLLLEAEELLTLKSSSQHRLAELKRLSNHLALWQKQWKKLLPITKSLRRQLASHDVATRDEHAQYLLRNLLTTLEHDLPDRQALEHEVAHLLQLATQDSRATATLIDNLLADVKSVLMLPFTSLLDLLPRLVRDLAVDGGKDIRLEVSGSEIEVDRRILEQLRDPLIHLVRNAVDHGIETPDNRTRAGKPGAGTLRVSISARDGNQFELAIADDGGGINLDRLQAVAGKLGLAASPLAADDMVAILDLICASGLSTSPILTDISGRGLGMAIVREKLEHLGGKLELETTRGQGTCFRLRLPTTLATFRGLLVAVDGQQLVLPITNVEAALQLAVGAIRSLEDCPTLDYAGQPLALVWLRDLLELPPGPATLPPTTLSVVVLGTATNRMAFAVDAILGDQEVLVKGLGPQLPRVRNVSASTVLGSGHVAPILNVPDLMKSASKLRYSAQALEQASQQQPAPKTLLLVEDSLTTRTLLKGMLEIAGYQVLTAVDGRDALAQLHQQPCDLVVADVEMPHLDGFALTAHLRQDPVYRHLPVILVTALGSRADRERGVDVGANAYIVKGSFDQNKLLETIRRLV